MLHLRQTGLAQQTPGVYNTRVMSYLVLILSFRVYADLGIVLQLVVQVCVALYIMLDSLSQLLRCQSLSGGLQVVYYILNKQTAHFTMAQSATYLYNILEPC